MTESQSRADRKIEMAQRLVRARNRHYVLMGVFVGTGLGIIVGLIVR